MNYAKGKFAKPTINERLNNTFEYLEEYAEDAEGKSFILFNALCQLHEAVTQLHEELIEHKMKCSK